MFAAPHSYTGQDVAEISAHGTPVILDGIVRAALRTGARLAKPGEFTLRAFLNGRIDLPRAEAVRDLIEATTLYQARVAAQQVEGSVSRRIAKRNPSSNSGNWPGSGRTISMFLNWSHWPAKFSTSANDFGSRNMRRT